jgi:ammonium transporter, Amt family
LVWTVLDSFSYGKPSVVGAINGMIAGLVGITPGAGYVNGWGAIAIGVCTGIIPWIMMNKVQTSALFKKVDDTLSVLSTHGVAGLLGGLLTGVLACPDMLEYIGTDKEAPGVSGTGWIYGNFDQFLDQVYAAAFIIVFNVIMTFVLLKIISIFVSLRMDETTLRVGDDAVHGETAYNFGDGEEPAVAE